jgi:hypothetical protein
VIVKRDKEFCDVSDVGGAFVEARPSTAPKRWNGALKRSF